MGQERAISAENKNPLFASAKRGFFVQMLLTGLL
jgi:hypothetical protein